MAAAFSLIDCVSLASRVVALTDPAQMFTIGPAVWHGCERIARRKVATSASSDAPALWRFFRRGALIPVLRNAEARSRRIRAGVVIGHAWAVASFPERRLLPGNHPRRVGPAHWSAVRTSGRGSFGSLSGTRTTATPE